MTTSVDLFLEYKCCPEQVALARLLERHRGGVYAVCLRVLRHSQDAEDACQDVLLKVSSQLDQVEEPGSFAGWLYRTALHTSLDFRRRRERHRVRVARAGPLSGVAVEPSAEVEALQRGLAGLDETSRELVIEHYLARRPLRELAEERGCSSVAVWKRIRNARERLRTSIGSAAMLALEAGGKVPAAAGLFGGLMTAKSALLLAIAAPLVLIGVVATVLSIRHAEPPAPVAAAPKALLRTAAVSPAKSLAAPELPKAAAVPLIEQTEPAPARKPYPFKLDPSSSNATVRTWAVLRSSRVSLDIQGTMLEVAREVQQQTGILIHCSPRHESEVIAFKVQQIVVDGCLQLLLLPRQMDYEIRPDGTVYCGSKDEITGGYERIGRRLEVPEYAVSQVRADLDAGWDGIAGSDPRTATADALRTKSLVLSQGMTTWSKEIERVKAETGLQVILDLPFSLGLKGVVTQPGTTKPFLQAVEEQSAGSIVDRCARDLGLVSCIREDGSIFLTTKENADEIARNAQAKDAAKLNFIRSLSKPVGGFGKVPVSDFLDSLMKNHGLELQPTEEAWNSSATVTLSPRLSVREGLDQLKAQGIRWAARDGKLFVLK